MANATRLLIKNGTLIDGSGGGPVPSRLLVVEGNRITLVCYEPLRPFSSKAQSLLQAR